mgnify:CR=1 FL=1
MILRGRYTSVSVQLYGRTDQDPLAAVRGALAAPEAGGAVAGGAVAGGHGHHPLPAEDRAALEAQQQALLQRQRQQQQQQGQGQGQGQGRGGKRPRLSLPVMCLPLRTPQPAEAGSEEAGKRTWPEGSMAPAPDLMPPGALGLQAGADGVWKLVYGPSVWSGREGLPPGGQDELLLRVRFVQWGGCPYPGLPAWAL